MTSKIPAGHCVCLKPYEQCNAPRCGYGSEAAANRAHNKFPEPERAWAEIERLRKQLVSARSALKDCIEVFESQEMMGVWGFLYAHGIQWTGKVLPLKEMREAHLTDEISTGHAVGNEFSNGETDEQGTGK